jgi:hypothetical protein
MAYPKQLELGLNKVEVAETRLAYYAGLFDGEGNVDLSKNSVGSSHRVRSQVSQKPKQLLEMCKSDFGGSLYHNKANGGWLWVLHANQAIRFFNAILPYLVLKREEVKLAIEYQRQLHARGGNGYILEQEHQAREDIINRFDILTSYRKKGSASK